MSPIILMLLAVVALGPHCSSATPTTSTPHPPLESIKKCFKIEMDDSFERAQRIRMGNNAVANMWVLQGNRTFYAGCSVEASPLKLVEEGPKFKRYVPVPSKDDKSFIRMVDMQLGCVHDKEAYIQCEYWMLCLQSGIGDLDGLPSRTCDFMYDPPVSTSEYEVTRCSLLRHGGRMHGAMPRIITAEEMGLTVSDLIIKKRTRKPKTTTEKPTRARRSKKSTRRLKRSSDSTPDLIYTFIEQAVQPGAQVALKCSAVGDPTPRFRWSLDGQPIPTHLGAIISESREENPNLSSNSNYVLTTLTLPSARVEHGGRYECKASNSRGGVSHSARLNVYGPPYIRAMNPVKAVAGSDLFIACPYYGFPIDSVKWEGGAGSDPRYDNVDGLLKITNVDKNRDKGAWTCSVRTPGGELARREVQITVVSPPVLSPIVFPPGLRSGDRSQLTCTVTSGDMPVYFSWLKDQMPISSSLQDAPGSGGSSAGKVLEATEKPEEKGF